MCFRWLIPLVLGSSAWAEEVRLGDPALTAGIPGVGALMLSQVEAWLANPRNHEPLTPRLPLGLAAGAVQVVGLEENPLTRAKIELGRQLFFDPRLSVDGTVSCASCHAPQRGYAFNTQYGIGVRKQVGVRNTPTAYNRILSARQFRDGRADSLEAQALGPIENSLEMGATHESCVKTLRGIPGYAVQFQRMFPDGVTIENAGRALASFERVVVTGPTPWDYHLVLTNFERAYAADLEEVETLAEDDPALAAEYAKLQADCAQHPLDEAAKRGGELFTSDRSGCTKCHVGANFTDEEFHNLGVGMDAPKPDWGRFVETKVEADRGAFKTPTLRNVAQTAPYMHDGSLATLEQVVALYVQGGNPNDQLSPKLESLDLTLEEQADLVVFLKSLTGELPLVEQGRLP